MINKLKIMWFKLCILHEHYWLNGFYKAKSHKADLGHVETEIEWSETLISFYQDKIEELKSPS